MEDAVYQRIVADARELKNLDQKVTKAIVDLNKEELPRLIVQFSELKKQLKTVLIDIPVAKIHDDFARRILVKVNQNEPFQTDRIVQAISSQVDEPVDLDELDNEEFAALAPKLYEWFSHYEYIEGLYEIGSLIVAVSVPPTLVSYLDEARQCYAFQQYNAMNALCRTVLEIALKHYGERKGLLPKVGDKVRDLDEYRPTKLIQLVRDSALRSRTRDLYFKTSTVLHGNKLASAEEAKKTFKEMLGVIQDLYR